MLASTVPETLESVEKVGFGADFSGVTMRFRASSAFRRNAADDGSANARRVAVLLLPLRRPDSRRPSTTTH